MKKLLIYPILAIILAVGVNIQGASAALFLSGDVNIVDSLMTNTNQYKPAVNTGNQQFFENILQRGKKVVVLDDLSWDITSSGTDDFGGTINKFYNSLYETLGVISTLNRTGTFTSADLTGVDLFVAPLPDDPFTEAEIRALQGLLARGGSVFFLGDHKGLSEYNIRINKALADLGSGMSIVLDGDFFDNSDGGIYPEAIPSQIATDQFTAGVRSFTYASPSQVKGGTPIFFGSEGQPFVAHEVPVPASAWLLGSGLLGLGFFRRRGRKYPAA